MAGTLEKSFRDVMLLLESGDEIDIRVAGGDPNLFYVTVRHRIDEDRAVEKTTAHTREAVMDALFDMTWRALEADLSRVRNLTSAG